MNANDEFEAFAQRFNARYNYLPLGKDHGCYPPNSVTILADLTHTFRELEELKAGAALLTTSQSVEICSDNPCDYCRHNTPIADCDYVGVCGGMGGFEGRKLRASA